MTVEYEKEVLSDADWELLHPLIEACRPRGKTPPQHLRRTVTAIVWRHTNGAKWRAIPPELGPWWMAAQTFIRWARLGVWERLLKVAQERGVKLGMAFLDGTSIRVPTPNVSVVDFKFVAKRATTKEEINAAIKAAADGPLKAILGYTDAPNVSMDFNHDPHSSIFHNDQTKVMEGKFVSVLSWYDNEWGFSNRMADTAVAMAKLI